ncbi:unnamed protein product, partial [Ectocarpus sp. 13 AM-2016]
SSSVTCLQSLSRAPPSGWRRTSPRHLGGVRNESDAGGSRRRLTRMTAMKAKSAGYAGGNQSGFRATTSQWEVEGQLRRISKENSTLRKQ